MKSLRIPLTVLCALLLSVLSSYAAQLASAKVVAVEGTATKYAADGSQSPLKVGDILKQGDEVTVTTPGSTKFVFSNGSVVTLKENTSVSFAKLEQEAFSNGQSYEQLQADPSKSQTLLELNYGDLDFHVKKLKPGSTFDIETPIGTAAIRGTEGTVSLQYNAELGQFILKIVNKVGRVNVKSQYKGSIEYSEGLGDKGFDSSASQSQSSPIPPAHTVVLRLHRNDPAFDTIFNLIKNFIPTETRPGFIKIPAPEITPEDTGVIVVSPEGPGSTPTL